MRTACSHGDAQCSHSMLAHRSAGGLAWLVASRHAALPCGCPVSSKRLLCVSRCNCAGTPRATQAERPRKPDKRTRQRLLEFKTVAGPPLEVTVREAASSAELRAAAHLRAASFFTYPLDRSEFSARVERCPTRACFLSLDPFPATLLGLCMSRCNRQSIAHFTCWNAAACLCKPSLLAAVFMV